MNRSAPIAESSLRGLHPRSISNPREISRLLKRAKENRSVFHRGLNTHLDLEIAQLNNIEPDELVFEAPRFDRSLGAEIFLNFNLDGRPYFFSTKRTSPIGDGKLVVQIPKEIFYSERRDRLRRAPSAQAGDPHLIEVSFEQGEIAEALVRDVSPGGFGLLIPRPPVPISGVALDLRFIDGAEAGSRTSAQLRNSRPATEYPGWTRLGIIRSGNEIIKPVVVENWATVAGDLGNNEAIRSVGADFDCGELQIVRFSNRRGEEIVGLIDSWGAPRGATAVVIPTGWGQTKETLLPLARTIVATFRAATEPVCVIRFDGVRKKGESHNDPICHVPGREYLHYVFSQGADDIEEVARFLRESPEYGVTSVVIVSFSAAAIEARKALARDREGIVNGWISVVGSPDVQSMTRAISGGVDFAVGHERMTAFGIQELLGVAVDIDRIVADGEKNDLLFIEQSRRDMASIRIPVTWYHGRFDAWVDFDRVCDILSYGNTGNRRLIVLPTGHRLKNSKQAEGVFQRISCEIGRIALKKCFSPRRAHPHEIHARRRAERARIPEITQDLRGFWRDYLIGRDKSYGIELLANSVAYRELMELQIELLSIVDGDYVLDLGSGVGTLAVQLSLKSRNSKSISVISVDYVHEAQLRARGRIAHGEVHDAVHASYVDADLDLLHDEQWIPLIDGSFDAVAASLLLSYLENPSLVLAEIYRLLKPGGRLVVSSLCRDADISRLYVEGVTELSLKTDDAGLPGFDRSQLANVARNFLNDAAKILQLEETGAFHFWEHGDLVNLVIDAGFSGVTARSSLGSPPQAIVVSAIKS